MLVLYSIFPSPEWELCAYDSQNFAILSSFFFRHVTDKDLDFTPGEGKMFTRQASTSLFWMHADIIKTQSVEVHLCVYMYIYLPAQDTICDEISN